MFLIRGTLIATLLLFAAGVVPFAAANWIILDDNTGHVLAASGQNEKRQIASLTKIATAMVVLDWAEASGTSLSTLVSVPSEVSGVGGVNPCQLQPGDQVSLRDLLYSAMMSSDNHAAYTLAQNVGQRLPNPQALSPVDNFSAQMNALARQLGMKRSLFLNPHGLDSMSPPPHSTAADLARLTRYAYSHAGFNFYVSQPTRKISIQGVDGTTRGFLLRNTNELLGRDGVEGVKTGRTQLAGDCLVLAADREPEAVERDGQKIAIPRRIIVVLLGSADRFSDGLALIQRGWSLHESWSAEGRPISKRSTL
ncbi:MAG: serine hydrolase [Verrucomicrobia bacterium]|jgi:serine-type D-Ala-D-Ala carboxypeptidase (penicillin-binding protein 5/6)|nr:serine hydrolase [Verrucomicrobiota bacterium]MDA1203706.1 serine hydrolase [Verrucomicrobiota bacterium]